MPPRKSLQENLDALNSLAADGNRAETVNQLKKALSGANNILIARAAEISGRQMLTELAPDLGECFMRLIPKPPASDKQCLAKYAIVEALQALEFDDPDVFLAGLHHVQMEPVYGGQADTAADLRGECALALGRMGYSDVFFEVSPLLMDPEPQPRKMAARVFGAIHSETGELLLRMKVMAGDRDLSVMAECLAALMQNNPERSLDFVAAFLDRENEELAESAALALGESRYPEALKRLIDAYEDSAEPRKKMMLLLPIGLNRSDQAFDFLLDILNNDHEEKAIAALRSLRFFVSLESRRQQIEAALEDRADPKLIQMYRSEIVSSA
ncbi:MAG: HEAT repeat domain-containing protein [Candidatus Sumerlaeota bacterium]